MSESFKPNKAQQRAIAVVLTLSGHEGSGLAPSVIARAVNTSDNRIFHDLRNLAAVGVAERLESGNWRLGPKLVQIALAMQHGLARLKNAAIEIEQRYTREPR